VVAFVLVPGAGGSAWDWHLLVPELVAMGHEAIAVDLPAADDRAGLPEYVGTVVRAVGDRRPVVLVAHSFGGFTAPLVCERLPIDLLVLVNAMIPAPGETFSAWWANTAQGRAQREFAAEIGIAPSRLDEDHEVYDHDVPEDVVGEAESHDAAQSSTPLDQPWPLDRWPDVPTRVLAGRDDRMFPAAFQRRVARERLGIEADEIAGGHMIALARPRELAERLDAYAIATMGEP
jgi:pimeloyl-ACP methyl ester carboxylesterase